MMATRLPCAPSRRLCQCLRRQFSSSPINHQTRRPPTAPKPIPNVRHIRDNPDLYSKNSIDRDYAAYAEYPHRIVQLAQETVRLSEVIKEPRAKIKEIERSIGRLAAAEGGAEKNAEQIASLRQEAQKLKADSEEAVRKKEEIEDEIQRLALSLPNLSHPATPRGDSPQLVSYLNFDPNNPPSWVNQRTEDRSHVTIGTKLGLIDFTSSNATTGWGWYFLTNEGALLEQALVNYAISVALRHGWKAVSPPSMVYSYITEACGYQPRDQHGEQQIWAIEQSEKDKVKPQRSLAGTAEIPLAAMYAGRDISVTSLPVKLVGASRCYRAEAGARGVDTKGLYRVHEFTKVELFGWADRAADSTTSSPQTDKLYDELLQIQMEILSSLGLPCRVLEMPTGDLGASATRKRDIEALFPSRLRAKEDGKPDLETAWGEVTSASICGDYQTRRLGTRTRDVNGKNPRYPHTVNGTAMAVPRVLAAILENGWDETRGVVVVPEVLRPWMGGLEVIGGN